MPFLRSRSQLPPSTREPEPVRTREPEPIDHPILFEALPRVDKDTRLAMTSTLADAAQVRNELPYLFSEEMAAPPCSFPFLQLIPQPITCSDIRKHE